MLSGSEMFLTGVPATNSVAAAIGVFRPALLLDSSCSSMSLSGSMIT